MLTPFILVRQGDTAVLIAQSSTVISSSQVNWYYQGNALTVNGAVSQSIGKYGTLLSCFISISIKKIIF